MQRVTLRTDLPENRPALRYRDLTVGDCYVIVDSGSSGWARDDVVLRTDSNIYLLGGGGASEYGAIADSMTFRPLRPGEAAVIWPA